MNAYWIALILLWLAAVVAICRFFGAVRERDYSDDKMTDEGSPINRRKE